jgi:tRNA threonylcarbamoyl adenosine modification protein (Sua5/YciO/YrdC/YwlC family)
MTAEAYLARLGERGIDYVFANAGTDFAPIVEGLSRNTGNAKFPKFLVVPHENVAMAMAHGYYRTCGKPAAVMVHVTVGTANTLCGLMNAARDNVPILLAAGRTPITETGHQASRNRSIHWGQESFDQGGMVREFVKWDYELRAGQPVDSVVDRALDIMMSEPRGPVYLTLPREVLANPATHMRRDTVRPLGVASPEPARRLIDCFWPGPLTLVLPARSDLPPALTAGSGTIGVRVSSHPTARALVDALGEPLTTTSANPGGEPPAGDVATARRYFGDRVAAYVDGGALAGGSGSTVLLVADDAARVIRRGAVAIEDLVRTLGPTPLDLPA